MEDNRAKWAAIGLRDYQFKFSIGCYCFVDALPISMVVQNGQLASMTNSRGEEVTGYDYDDFLTYTTVEGMFGQIDEALAKNWYVEIKYDPIYGFPNEFYVSARIPDSFSFVTITEFEAHK